MRRHWDDEPGRILVLIGLLDECLSETYPVTSEMLEGLTRIIEPGEQLQRKLADTLDTARGYRRDLREQQEYIERLRPT
jgi:hypothetical protein